MYIVKEREVMIIYTVKKVKYGWAVFKNGIRVDEHATRDKEKCEAIATVMSWLEL